ncbi:hypothetical protein [Andreprevotia chitinilytica]|uniref:hypothetical protein n=1 Tax=Andreprevotia chitinilytica TaxID=396808 RepID=UPI0012EB7943|nr:hypothetical protein [Andreprevotia chitinilytica]
MDFVQIVDSVLKVLQSAAIVAVGGMIWKAFREQIAAANATKAVKDETIAALKESHAGEVAALRAQNETLKAQRDFGSDQAKKIRDEDLKTLEDKLAKLIEENKELLKTLDEAKRHNAQQIEKNSAMLIELENMPPADPGKFDIHLNRYVTNLKQTNSLLIGSNTMLEQLTPMVMARSEQPFSVFKKGPFIHVSQPDNTITLDADQLNILLGTLPAMGSE